jgi:hypothetical protein
MSSSRSPGFLLDNWNNFLHLPVVEDLVWYNWWGLGLLLGPLHSLWIFLMFVLDVCTGALWRRQILEEPQGRAVLVTGCDSGFGRDIALELASRGWKVYAGCLAPEAAQSLEAGFSANEKGGRLVGVALDVTKAEQISQAVRLIEAAEPGSQLYGVVNNAGKLGPGGFDSDVRRTS